jgi:alkylation response protein AidB-like acyl-CoA dehydrogenase
MQFGLTDSQILTRNSAREFFSAEFPIAEVRRLCETETAHDRKLWRKTAEQGWCGMTIPEAYGGMGLDLVEVAAAMEEAGRTLVPGPLLAHLTATAAIAACASEEHKQQLLPALATGERIVTFAILEPTPSWDLAAVAMPACEGAKLFVMDAAVTDYIVTLTRDGVFLVDSRGDGVTLTPMPALDTSRKLSAVHYQNAPGLQLATDNNAVQRALDIGTTLLCAEMTGAMQRMLDITVNYVKTRKQFGKPVGAFQLVQALCADMLVATESARSATYFAAYALEQNLPEAQSAVSVAKSYIADAARLTGNNAIQAHGGMGFTWENDIHLYYRRAKAFETAFGDAVFHRERIAQLAL